MNITNDSVLQLPINAVQNKGNTLISSDFKILMNNDITTQAKTSNFIQALEDFYQIHQRSQITGVPTAEYNQAVKALGLNPDEDPFAGIRVLEQAGFAIGSPTIGAILEYGSKPQSHGNQSYLAQTSSNQTDLMVPNPAQMIGEINELNEAYDNMLGSASNYFEAAQAIARDTDIQRYASMTLREALPLIQANFAYTVQSQSTMDWIVRRL